MELSYTLEGSVSISTCNWLFLNYRQQDLKYNKLRHAQTSITTRVSVYKYRWHFHTLAFSSLTGSEC